MNNRIKLAAATIVVVVAAVVFLIVTKQENLTEANSVTVYFLKTPAGSEYKVLPVRRKVGENADRFKFALAALMKGPSGREKKQGYFSEIPAGTKVLGISSTAEKKVINLSGEFETGGGSSSMEMRMEQLIDTALDSAGKKPVYLQIEGEQVSIIGGEGIPVPQPLAKTQNKGSEGPCK